MNRRNFFRSLASGLIVAAAPQIFLPKLVKPVWKPFGRLYPYQVELLKRMLRGDDPEAARAFASYIGPVIKGVLNQAGTASLIYQDYPYAEDNLPSFPIKMYYGPPRKKRGCIILD